MNIDKHFYSAFDIRHFQEADFDKEAVQRTLQSKRSKIDTLFNNLKTSLENVEQQIDALDDGTNTKGIRAVYQNAVDLFAELAIAVNTLWTI